MLAWFGGRIKRDCASDCESQRRLGFWFNKAVVGLPVIYPWIQVSPPRTPVAAQGEDELLMEDFANAADVDLEW